MRRWILPPTATTAEQLRLEEAPVPDPGPGEVRLRVAAVSLNARDRMIVAGPFGRLPDRALVPLSDVAGRVDALGDGVTEWAAGDRVTTAHVPSWVTGPAPQFGIGPGSLDDDGVAAEQVVVPAQALVRAPASLDDAEASTLQVAGVTAWNSLFGAAPVGPGDRVGVIGTGGVALFALQLARALGAQVYGAVRQPSKGQRLLDLGATDVVAMEDPNWPGLLADLSGGLTKVVNTVGPGLLNECLATLAGSGEVAVPGLYDMTQPGLDAMALIGKQASVRGVAVGSVQMHRDLCDFIDRHQVRPVIDTRLPFDDLPGAFDALASPALFGKVVIELG